MTEKNTTVTENPTAASPVISEGRNISVVWLIPLIALLVGVWLAYTAIAERGPIITVIFEDAEGIEPGKTKVKFKDVVVGVVESVVIDKDLSGVVLLIEMNKEVEQYLTEDTKFWIVRARVGADQISGLGTLLGGVYIGVEPSKEGRLVDEFIGLEKPPIVTSDMQGKHFFLNAERLGSLDAGSPVYFRQIKVGRVVDYALEEKTGNVSIHVFIFSPYDQFVRQNTAFWLASGLDLRLTANGLRIDTESVVSLLIGGVAFNTLSESEPKPIARENMMFTLYRTREEAKEGQYVVDEYYYIEFTDSVRGLSIGAPVEFRGMRIGSVEEIELKADFDDLDFTPMVRVSLEKQRLTLDAAQDEKFNYRLAQMVKRGLRAHLKTGNLLTGQLFIDLEYFGDAPEAVISTYKKRSVLPSVPSASQQIAQDLAGITSKLNKLPLQVIANELRSVLAGLNKLVNDPHLQSAGKSLQRLTSEIEATVKKVNTSTVPEIVYVLVELQSLLKEMKAWLSTDGQLYDELGDVLKNVSKAAKAIRNVADLLERQPEVLIQGKRKKGHNE